MNSVLRGNYTLPNNDDAEHRPNKPEESPAQRLEKEFEAEALRHLGGSITFVKKSATFTWRKEKDRGEVTDVTAR